MVRNPWLRIDHAIFNELNDAGEILRERVATRHDRQLAPVQVRGVREGELLLRDADVNHASGEGRIGETGNHRLVATCGVDNDIGELAMREGRERGDFRAVALSLNDAVHLHDVGAELQPLGVHVHDDTFRARDLHEFYRGKPDGARPDNQDGFPYLGGGPIHGVATDRERLDERELIVGKFGRDV